MSLRAFVACGILAFAASVASSADQKDPIEFVAGSIKRIDANRGRLTVYLKLADGWKTYSLTQEDAGLPTKIHLETADQKAIKADFKSLSPVQVQRFPFSPDVDYEYQAGLIQYESAIPLPAQDATQFVVHGEIVLIVSTETHELIRKMRFAAILDEAEADGRR